MTAIMNDHVRNRGRVYIAEVKCGKLMNKSVTTELGRERELPVNVPGSILHQQLDKDNQWSWIALLKVMLRMADCDCDAEKANHKG